MSHKGVAGYRRTPEENAAQSRRLKAHWESLTSEQRQERALKIAQGYARNRNHMSNVIKFGGEVKPTGEQLIRREQIAAQVVAVMQAHFSRPGPEEMKEILRCVEGQITALCPPSAS